MTQHPYSTVIIDDEPDACNLISNHLKKHPGIIDVTSFTNSEDGLAHIKKNPPDILFLDMIMGKPDGIDILESIVREKLNIYIVIVTAHEKTIIKAAHYNMIDYILKPVDTATVEAVIQKILKLDNFQSNINQVKKFNQSFELKIRIPSSFEEFYFIPEEIFYLEADSNYTHIYTVEGQLFTSSFHLGKIQQLLPPNIFFRISRKVIINLRYLRRIDKKNKICVLSHPEKELPYSRTLLKKQGLL